MVDRITASLETPPHVAILSFPMGSHPSTLFTVAKTLSSSAPLATFSFICTSKSFSSLSQHPLQTKNLNLCHGLKVEEEKYGNFFNNMIPYLKEGIDIAVENKESLKVTCIVADGLMPVAGKIAREMNVTWIPVRCTGPALVLSHLYYKELKQAYEEVSEADMYINDSITPSLSVLKYEDIPDFLMLGDTVSLNTGTAEEFPKADAVVLNTFEGLDPLFDLEFKSKFKKYLPVGPTVLMAPPPPPLLADDDRCMKWLDYHNRNSVIYICFGTYNSPSKQELAELADALLEKEDVSFLWSLPDKDRDELPPDFEKKVEEERGMLVKWAPQGRVLKHEAVGAFLTHGGWNSVMEGIAGGVPMICRPFRWDQMMNVRMVSEAYKTGVTIEEVDFEREELVKMVRMVMLEEVGRQMRHRATMVREMAEAAVGKDGSSSRNLKSVVEIMYQTS